MIPSFRLHIKILSSLVLTQFDWIRVWSPQCADFKLILKDFLVLLFAFFFLFSLRHQKQNPILIKILNVCCVRGRVALNLGKIIETSAPGRRCENWWKWRDTHRRLDPRMNVAMKWLNCSLCWGFICDQHRGITRNNYKCIIFYWSKLTLDSINDNNDTSKMKINQ